MNQGNEMLLEEVNKRFMGREWYHQRFDGAPMFMAMIAEGEVRREARKPSGTEARWRIGFFEGSHGDWFLDQEDIRLGSEAITQLAVQEDDVSSRLMAEWQLDEAAFERYYLAFDRRQLTAMTDETLAHEFEHYRSLATARFSSSSMIDHFALGSDEQIANQLRQELGTVVNESQFNAAFSVATAPFHQSFINQAEIALLKIACQVQAGQLLESVEIQRQLTEHQQAYYWINNNYVNAQVLSVEFFEQEIRAWLASGKELGQQVDDLGSTSERNRRAKAEFFSNHPLSPDLRKLLKISEDFTWWQDERKRATYLSIDIGWLLLTEMARRRSVEPEPTKWLLPSEVSGWFLRSEGPSWEELVARTKQCVVIWTEELELVASGGVANEVHDLVLPPTTTNDVQDLRGLVANTGRAVGTARVVMSASDIAKVGDGDILIAVMTRPDYVPAMKRAAAIVTDEGGITSHAAIVSRELNVPCVIGTKIATKVFKDGDLVEVNANHGIVRTVEV